MRHMDLCVEIHCRTIPAEMDRRLLRPPGLRLKGEVCRKSITGWELLLDYHSELERACRLPACGGGSFANKLRQGRTFAAVLSCATQNALFPPLKHKKVRLFALLWEREAITWEGVNLFPVLFYWNTRLFGISGWNASKGGQLAPMTAPAVGLLF